MAAGGHPELAYARTQHLPSRLLLLGYDYELDGGFAVARDDDLFPAFGGGDELGEVGLGVMDVAFHALTLAKRIS